MTSLNPCPCVCSRQRVPLCSFPTKKPIPECFMFRPLHTAWPHQLRGEPFRWGSHFSNGHTLDATETVALSRIIPRPSQQAQASLSGKSAHPTLAASSSQNVLRGYPQVHIISARSDSAIQCSGWLAVVSYPFCLFLGVPPSGKTQKADNLLGAWSRVHSGASLL